MTYEVRYLIAILATLILLLIWHMYIKNVEKYEEGLKKIYGGIK